MRLISLCAILFAALSLQAVETVRVGVNVSLSGGGVITAEELLRAVELKAQQLNSNEGAAYHYEIVPQDNQTTSKGSAMAAQKLISVDKVDALITVYDYAVGPTSPLAKRAKIASIGLGWGANLVEGEYNFLFGCSEVASGREIAEVLSKQPQKHTVILAARAPATGFLVEEMVENAKLDQRPKVFWYNPQESDFRTLLLKAQQEKPECLVLVSYGPHFDKIMHQLKMMPDFTPELVGFGFAFRFAKDPEQVEGAPFVAPGAFPQEQMEAFEAYADMEVTQEYVPFAYDSLGLLNAALLQKRDVSLPMRERITQALRDTKEFEGVSGKYTQDDAGVYDTQPQVYKMVDGVEVLVD